jgi:hypothetical protein
VFFATYTPRPSGPPHGGPAPLLIEAASGHADQDLAAAAFGVMDVPVVAAARLKGHIENTDLFRGNGRKKAPACKILRKAVVGRTDGEDHGRGMPGHGAVARRSGLFHRHFLYFHYSGPRSCAALWFLLYS